MWKYEVNPNLWILPFIQNNILDLLYNPKCPYVMESMREICIFRLLFKINSILNIIYLVRRVGLSFIINKDIHIFFLVKIWWLYLFSFFLFFLYSSMFKGIFRVWFQTAWPLLDVVLSLPFLLLAFKAALLMDILVFVS